MSHNPSDTGLSPSAVFQITPPGPAWQKINSILHQEPIATIVYGFYWSFALLFMTPIAVFVLQVLTILKLILYGLHLTGDTTFDPSSKRNADKELAIVITGCDSGIGRETALWAAGTYEYRKKSHIIKPRRLEAFLSCSFLCVCVRFRLCRICRVFAIQSQIL